MKKSILTIGLFSLVMILTSFTTPETVSATNVENRNSVDYIGGALSSKKNDYIGGALSSKKNDYIGGGALSSKKSD